MQEIGRNQNDRFAVGVLPPVGETDGFHRRFACLVQNGNAAIAAEFCDLTRDYIDQGRTVPVLMHGYYSAGFDYEPAKPEEPIFDLDRFFGEIDGREYVVAYAYRRGRGIGEIVFPDLVSRA